MDDVNPMRSREARDDLRERVMDGLASGIAKGAIRHEVVLALLDLADEGETAQEKAETAERRRYDGLLKGALDEWERILGDVKRERDTARSELRAIDAFVQLAVSCDHPNPEGLLDCVQYAEGRAEFSTFQAFRELVNRLGEEKETAVAAFHDATRLRTMFREERDQARDCGQDGVCAIAPGCQRHWAERNRELVAERDATLARAARAVETAYTLGARDAQRVAAGVARRERDAGETGKRKWDERRKTAWDSEGAADAACMEDQWARAAGCILDGIEALDPTRARPALEVLLAEPGTPCPTCDGQGGWKEGTGHPNGEGGEEFMAVECPSCGGQGLVPPEVTR